MNDVGYSALFMKHYLQYFFILPGISLGEWSSKEGLTTQPDRLKG